MVGRREVSQSKCPLGWDPVAAGNRAGDGMDFSIEQLIYGLPDYAQESFPPPFATAYITKPSQPIGREGFVLCGLITGCTVPYIFWSDNPDSSVHQRYRRRF